MFQKATFQIKTVYLTTFRIMTFYNKKNVKHKDISYNNVLHTKHCCVNGGLISSKYTFLLSNF